MTEIRVQTADRQVVLSRTTFMLSILRVVAFSFRQAFFVWGPALDYSSLLWGKSFSIHFISFHPSIAQRLLFDLLPPCGSSGPCLSGGQCLPSFTALCSLYFSGSGRPSAGPPGPIMSSPLPFALGWRLPPWSSPLATSVEDTSTQLSPSPTWSAPRCPCFGLSSTSSPSVSERWPALLCSMGLHPAMWGETWHSTR